MGEEPNPKDAMRERALRAMLADAFFRWESAATIALTMLLVFFVPQPFEWWHPVFWVIGGALAELALIIAHVTDPQSAQQAISRMFLQKYDPRSIRNPVARQRAHKAIEYRAGIEALVRQQTGAMRLGMQETLDEIDDWIEQIFRLARRMDHFQEDSILERDRRAVPQELEKLRIRLQREADPTVRRELEDAIRLKEQQLANLQAVASNMKRAEIQLDNTLAALGTLYAQMQVIDTKDVDSARTRRLREEIHDEVAELQDTILAMDEVYTARLGG